MTELLTIDKLNLLPAEAMFASGITNDKRLHHEIVKWVAVKGGASDWAIYYHQADFEYETIALIGEKVTIEGVIKTLVPCDEEAFNVYRY
jgi:hypothetical protein